MRRRRETFAAAVADVVRNGNCSGCGGCAALSPSITMDLDGAGFLRPRWVGSADDPSAGPDLRDRFRAVCPGVAVPGRDRRSAPQSHPVFGRYVAMWAGYATDDELRFRGSSGGVLSALSQWRLDTDPAARLVAARRAEQPPTRTEVTVLRTRDDVLAAAGSRYAPVSAAAAFAAGPAPQVFVGKPCEAYAARGLSDGSTTILSFFCAGTPSQRATDDLVRQLGADPARVTTLRYRGHGCPGRFTVDDASGASATMTYDESWGRHLGRALQDRCKICADGTGEHADVAVGDYWATDARGFPVFDEGDGTSVVIARTERGVRLIEDAVAAGVLVVEPVRADDVARVQPFQATRRRSLLGRLAGRRLAGRAVPRYRGHGLVVRGMRSPRETIRQARGTFSADARRAGELAVSGSVTGDPGDVVVLQSFPPPQRVNNPYTSLLLTALNARPGITVHAFSWRFALTGRYDVLHLHWPETLIERRRLHTTVIRQICFVMLVLRCVARRTAIVRTVHNLELPQGLPRHQIVALRLVERLTTLRIVINESTRLEPGTVVATIPHGHYRDWYRVDDRIEPVAGRIAFFGRIRRYKRVDLLVKAFAELPPGHSLRIAGRPSSEALADELRALAADDPNISLRLDYLADDDMVVLIRESELVVLPYPEMHNSGTVLAALSLDRPVLVCDNEVNRRLADEVGAGWVLCYRGELTGADIENALDEVRRGERDRPSLERRDWSAGGRLHAQAYRRAVETERTRSRRSRFGVA